jgi:hypothetical protein
LYSLGREQKIIAFKGVNEGGYDIIPIGRDR